MLVPVPLRFRSYPFILPHALLAKSFKNAYIISTPISQSCLSIPFRSYPSTVDPKICSRSTFHLIHVLHFDPFYVLRFDPIILSFFVHFDSIHSVLEAAPPGAPAVSGCSAAWGPGGSRWVAAAGAAGVGLLALALSADPSNISLLFARSAWW